tara:strand:+ start:126 stop:296 length:171 start_codon:yes stop_codon:yes gene_type:complete
MYNVLKYGQERYDPGDKYIEEGIQGFFEVLVLEKNIIPDCEQVCLATGIFQNLLRE